MMSRFSDRLLDLRIIFTSRYRAFLLDIVTFIFNLILMSMLTNLLSNLAGRVRMGNPLAEVAMALFCLGLVFLQPMGALLKRQQAHQRNPDLNTDVFAGVGRWLFLGYFVVQLMFAIFASLFLNEVFGWDTPASSGRLALFFVGIPLVAAANTFIIYFYFVPPKHEARLRVLMSPPSEVLGDVSIFVGTLCFQTLWWFLLDDPYFSSRPNDLGELAGKIISFVAMALMLYFPPRIFYWAKASNRKIIWVSMVLTNLPILVRILFGAS